MSKNDNYRAKREAARRAKGVVTQPMRQAANHGINRVAVGSLKAHSEALHAILITADMPTDVMAAKLADRERHMTAIEKIDGGRFPRGYCIFPGCSGVYIADLDETYLFAEGVPGPLCSGWVYTTEHDELMAHDCAVELPEVE